MGPSHEVQCQLLTRQGALILGAGQAKSPKFHPGPGLLKFLILWSAQGTRGDQSGLILREDSHSLGDIHSEDPPTVFAHHAL